MHKLNATIVIKPRDSHSAVTLVDIFVAWPANEKNPPMVKTATVVNTTYAILAAIEKLLTEDN